MKEQYIGDVKDYGKYRFLKTLCECSGLKLGINWYLTRNDSSNQGNFGRILSCTDELYSKVRGLKNFKATLSDVEHSGILPASTVYYHNPLRYYHDCDNKTLRTKWHGNALNALGACDIIFLDPDTGVVTNDFLNPNGQIRDSFYKCNERRDGTRYVLLEEIEDYLTAGKSLILFQYGQRMGIEPQLKSVYERLARYFSIPSCTFIFRYSSSSTDAIAIICYNQTKHSYAFTRFASALQDKSNLWSNYFSLWEEPIVFSNELVNKGKIVEASTLSGGPVGNFVASTLRKHYGSDWWAEVEQFFTNQKYPPRPLGRSDAQRADSLDISKSLQLIDGFWSSVFSKYMQQKPNVSSAIRIINIAKHENNQSGFSDKETFDSLMTLISVLEMTGNKSEATLLRQNYLDVGKKILDISRPMLDKIKAGQVTNTADNRQTDHPKKTTSQTGQPSQGQVSPQTKLRALVLKIPEGKVTTYGWLAKQIYSNTGATPAVLSMIKSITGTSVPCHRVVSSDGKPKASDLNYGNTGKTQKQLLHSEGVVFTDSNTIDFDKCMFQPVLDGE